jgi:hypothetical protein
MLLINAAGLRTLVPVEIMYQLVKFVQNKILRKEINTVRIDAFCYSVAHTRLLPIRSIFDNGIFSRSDHIGSANL